MKRVLGKIGDAYHIRWTDAASGYASWEPAEAVSLAPVVAETLGFVVESRKDHIVLAQNRDANNMVSDLMTIPRANIRRMKRLRL